MDEEIKAKKKRGERLTYRDFHYYSNGGLGLIIADEELVPLREFIEYNLCERLMNNEKKAEQIIQDHLHKYKVINLSWAILEAETEHDARCRELENNAEELKTFLETTIQDPEYIQYCKDKGKLRLPVIENDYQLECIHNVIDMFGPLPNSFLGSYYPKLDYDGLEALYRKLN